MDFRIADTFTDALARLPTADQKAVKTSGFDLQTNQQHPGLQCTGSTSRATLTSCLCAPTPMSESSCTRPKRVCCSLCRPSRQGLRVGRATAYRGASEDWRSPDCRGPRAGRRDRATSSSRSCARRFHSPLSFRQARRRSTSIGRRAGRLARRRANGERGRLSRTRASPARGSLRVTAPIRYLWHPGCGWGRA
jgi:hypothetical protein